MGLAVIRPNDIVYFNLDPTRGHETCKIRPCLVVGIPTDSQGKRGPSGIAIILPITSRQHNFWTEVPIRKRGQMKGDSYILCHQIRAVDLSRAGDKIAEAEPSELKRVKQVLRILLSI